MYVLVALVLAQPFADDFDAPDGGAWTRMRVLTGVTVERVTADGRSILRVTDDDRRGSGEGEQATLQRDVSAGPSQFQRFWLRAGPGSAGRNAVGGIRADGWRLINALWVYSDGKLELHGFRNGGYDFIAVPGHTLAAGTWHLVELQVDGIGTMQARRRFWLDGQLASDTAADLRGFTLLDVVLGAVWQGPTSQAVELSFDDVRASADPQPSTIAVALTGGPAGCVPVRVTLLDSEGAPRGLFRDVTAELRGGAFFFDAGCSQAAQSIVFSPGTSELTVWLLAQPGEARVEGVNLDFLSRAGPATFTGSTPTPTPTPMTMTMTMTMTPDLSEERVRDLGVGCACSETPSAVLIGLALALVLRRRQRTRSL